MLGKVKILKIVKVLLGEKEITTYNIVTLKSLIIQIVASSVGLVVQVSWSLRNEAQHGNDDTQLQKITVYKTASQKGAWKFLV